MRIGVTVRNPRFQRKYLAAVDSISDHPFHSILFRQGCRQAAAFPVCLSHFYGSSARLSLREPSASFSSQFPPGWGGILSISATSPFTLSGNVIDLGVTQLQVVDACSGLAASVPLDCAGSGLCLFFRACPVETEILRGGNDSHSRPDQWPPTRHHGDTDKFLRRKGCRGVLSRFHRMVAVPGSDLPSCSFSAGDRAISPPRVSAADKADQTGPSAKGVVENINKPFFVTVAILLIVCFLSLSTGAMPPVKILDGIAGFPLSFSGWQGAVGVCRPGDSQTIGR